MESLSFLGAAGTVTGSKHLIDLGAHRVLIDCGLFQGLKELRLRNWQPLPVEPASIDAVILTHAHLDHSGYLPRLVSAGFRGRIFCTLGTADLCRIVLLDAARLQEEDARQANRHGYTRHDPALPLFTQPDAYRALSQLQPVGYERPVPVVPGLEVEFVNAGHLLGSAYARVVLNGPGGLTILFGGDLGRYNRPVLPDPSPPKPADVLLLESTYGDRLHADDADGQRLAEIVRDTSGRGGKLVIPAFAIGRVEEVLYWLKHLEEAKRIPSLPVYVDSPMAIEALKSYSSRSHELDLDPDVRRARGELSAFMTARFRVVSSISESRALVASHIPAIIVSSSGMATGGRVLNHLEQVLPDRRHTVLFVGFQAAGTRGRQLVDGAPAVNIHGRMVPVAARIEQIDSMSAHADVNEILRWLGGFQRPPLITYLVHGEPPALTALERTIEERLHWPVEIAEYRQTIALDSLLSQERSQ